MADTQPNDAFDDELLSAYVDGELSGEQLAQVEQRLREDSQARQLVDELRTLSTTLQAMPHETIGEDLREAVLRRAERSRLPKEKRGVRRWGWAAMALAATLLLMVYQPGEEREEPKLAAVDAVKEKTARPVPELRAPVAKPLAAVVEGAEVFEEAVAEAPVRVVHLMVADDAVDFDQLLASNGLVRIDQVRRKVAPKFERSLSKSSRDRQSESASEAKASPVVEVLAEGTAEQIRNLLSDSQSGIHLYATRGGKAGSLAFGSLSSSLQEYDADQAEGDSSGPAELLLRDGPSSGSADASAIGKAKKQKSMERIQVQFMLHPAPQSAKPAATNKKARSSEKTGGKEG
ncbi:MAG: hypothetical protein GXP26_00055 [Planctomycetes bacterium]|nr:hypothetical protein [Planctomycetota bacterium]